MKFCETCGRLTWPDIVHSCPPRWDVWCPEDGGRDGATTVHATDDETAAEKWGSQCDSETSYAIVDSGGAVVCVARVGCDDVAWYRVTGEATIDYTAEEIKKPTDD